MAIGSGDITKYRSARQTIRPVVNLSPRLSDIIIATADVNQATITFPLASLTVDNKSTDFNTLVQPGMFWRLHDSITGAITAYGVIRKATSSNTVFIDAKSGGSSGLSQAIKNTYADNQRLEVYKYYAPWILYSRVASSAFFKQYDLAYTDQGAKPDPIIRMGSHLSAEVRQLTDVATFAFDFSQPHAWNSSISSISVDLDGGTLETGTLASGIFTASFAPSTTYYVVRCTITLANTKSFTGIRYVFVKLDDPDSEYAPFGLRYGARIGSDTQTIAGRELEISTGANLPDDAFYPYQMCHIRFDAGFPDEDLDTPANRVRYFVGFATQASIAQRFLQADEAVKFQGPLLFAAGQPNSDQAIIEKASPARWTEVNATQSHPVGAVYYLMRWHCQNVWALFDFHFDNELDELRRGAFGFQDTVLASQLNKVATIARATLGCRSDGTFVFRRKPWLLENDERNDLDVKYTIEDADLAEEVEVPFVWRLPIATLIAGGMAYPGQARGYRSRTPGAIAEQGISIVNQEDFSILPTEGQERVNQIVGHMFAEAASPVESLPLRLKLMLDVFEPCDGDIYVWKAPENYKIYKYLLRYLASGNLSSSTILESGVNYVQIRVRPVRVTRAWNYGRGITQSLVTDVQPETYGVKGILESIPSGGAAPQQPTSGILPGDNFQPAFPIPLATQEAFGLGWVDVGSSIKFGYTREMGRNFPHWINISSLITGDVVSADWDYSSPYISSGYTAGVLRAYVLTFISGTYRIYRISDLRTASPSATLQETFSTSNTLGFGQIRSSKTTADFAVCALIETLTGQPYVRYTRSTNGTSWSALTTLAEADAEDAAFEISVEGSTQLVPAQIAAGVYGLYRATTTGGAFSALSPNIASDRLPRSVSNNGSGTAYAEQVRATPAILLLNFDDPFDYSYVLNNGAPGGTAAVTGGGNPGNCANFGWASTAVTNWDGSVDITFPAGLGILSVAFDLIVSTNPSAFRPRVIYTNWTDGSTVTGSTTLTATPNSVSTSWTTHSVTLAQPMNYYTGGGLLEIQLWRNTSVAGTISAGSGQIDNITIVTTTEGSNLFKFTTYASAPAKSVVTPSGLFLPQAPFGLAASGSALSLIAADEDGFVRYLESANSGGAWTDRGSTSRAGVIRGANIRVAFGESRIELSNNGRDFYTRFGDFGQKVGYGLVKGLRVIL